MGRFFRGFLKIGLRASAQFFAVFEVVILRPFSPFQGTPCVRPLSHAESKTRGGETPTRRAILA